MCRSGTGRTGHARKPRRDTKAEDVWGSTRVRVPSYSSESVRFQFYVRSPKSGRVTQRGSCLEAALPQQVLLTVCDPK